jgi:hypothetical protein
MRAIRPLAVICLLLSGCIFQNLSDTRRLQDTVYQFNDETRWARIDLASQRVSPDYRARFLLAHRMWGHDIAIADVDPTNIQMAEEGDSASSQVTVTWYDQRTMELHSSVLTQHWVKTDNGYLLDSETIIGGSDDLLVPPSEDPEDVEAAPLASR